MLMSSIVADSLANKGGALYAQSGLVEISNATLFRNNSARSRGVGATILVEAAEVIYLLPVPAGHYINALPCEVTWTPCPSGSPCNSKCGGTNIDLEPVAFFQPQTQAECTVDRPPYNIQGCPWSSNLSANALGRRILHKTLEALRPGALNLPVWPIPCAPGIQGATEESPEGQVSALCGGFCDAGFYCPTQATFEPLPCPGGAFLSGWQRSAAAL
jgi:hypothetical protein